MNKSSKMLLGLIFFLYEWVLLTQSGWNKQAIPLVLIWGLFIAIVGWSLYRGNPLASLLGRPLHAGWTFLWVSLPIGLNFFWGAHTHTLHIKHILMTAMVVWIPTLFWFLGNFVRDRVLMDVLMISTLLLPWKLKFLDQAWSLGVGSSGFHGIYGLIAIHVGLVLLPSRLELSGLMLGSTKGPWLKGCFILGLSLAALFLAVCNGLAYHRLEMRASLPFEVLSLIVVFAFIEEWMYRGFAQNYFASLTGSSVLGRLSAAAVGAGLSMIGNPIAALGVGMVAGVIFLWTSSLVVTAVTSGVLRVILVLFFI